MIDRRLRVLVVVNEANRCDEIVNYLRDCYASKVDKATTVEQAWNELLQTGSPYNLALIDDTLAPSAGQEPKEVGIDLTTRIKNRSPNTEIIVFTSQDAASTQEGSREASFRCLTKPFHLSDLAAAVRESFDAQGAVKVFRKKERFKQFLKLSARMLESRDETEAADSLVKAIRAIGFERVRLYLLSDDRQRLVCKSHVGMAHEPAPIRCPATGDTAAKPLYMSTGPFVKRGYDPAWEFENLTGENNIEERAYIPLALRNKMVGLVAADNKFSCDPIDEKELRAAALFASQAAAALDGAGLILNTRQRLLDIQAILELADVIASSLDVGQISTAASKASVELLGANHGVLVLLDPDQSSGTVQAEFPGHGALGLRLSLPTEMIKRFADSGEPISISDIQNEFPLDPLKEILVRLDVRSALIVPIVLGGAVVGLLSLHAIGKLRQYTEEEIELCKLFAGRLAVALDRAVSHKDPQKEIGRLWALHKTAKSIMADPAAGLDRTLNKILNCTVECFEPDRDSGTLWSSVHLFDEAAGEFSFQISHPQKELCPPAAPDRDDSVRADYWERLAAQVMLSNSAQIVNDILDTAECAAATPKIKSEMAAPISKDGKVMGVVSIGSCKSRAFDRDDLKILESLADMAVIAIHNRKVSDLVGARTALAWMGMTSSTWRHAIHGHAITIKDLVEQAGWELKKSSLISVKERLSEIYNLAGLIGQLPIIAPLTSEEGVRSVLINSFLQERFKQLWEHEAYKSIALKMDLELGYNGMVKANSDWLNRALDVLVDNAVQAMKNSEEKVLTVRNRRQFGYAVIDIIDTGKGIPQEIMSKLLVEPINLPNDHKHLGLGLLMAQLIVRVYGGDIICSSTGAKGTTMTMRLPLIT
ncbi:MAG TPA: GAF domain-containing protein [Blastocatellia bacterium]|nr:GAF domain-containing protein [Blastocatellia bacterium]